jgi:hypothetical protein
VATTRVLLIFICVKDLCWITTISCGMRKNRKCNILWRGFNGRGISSSFHACMTTSRHLNKFLHFRPTQFSALCLFLNKFFNDINLPSKQASKKLKFATIDL